MGGDGKGMNPLLQTIAAIGSGGRSLQTMVQAGYDQRAKEEEHNRQLQLLQGQALYRQAEEQGRRQWDEHMARVRFEGERTLQRERIAQKDPLEERRMKLAEQGQGLREREFEQGRTEFEREFGLKGEAQGRLTNQRIADMLESIGKGEMTAEAAELAQVPGSPEARAMGRYRASNEMLGPFKKRVGVGGQADPTFLQGLFGPKERAMEQVGEAKPPFRPKRKAATPTVAGKRLSETMKYADQDLVDLIQGADEPKKVAQWMMETVTKYARAGSDPKYVASRLKEIKERMRKGDRLDAILAEETKRADETLEYLLSLQEEWQPEERMGPFRGLGVGETGGVIPTFGLPGRTNRMKPSAAQEESARQAKKRQRERFESR